MNLTYNQRIAAGYGAMVVLMLITSVLAMFTLRSVVDDKDRLLATNVAGMLRARELQTLVMQSVADARGYLVGGDARFLARGEADDAQVDAAFKRLRADLPGQADQQALARIEAASQAWRDANAAATRSRRAGASIEATVKTFEADVAPRAAALRQQLDALVGTQTARLEAGRQASNANASKANALMAAFGGLSLILAVALATILGRGLTRQVGRTIQHLQSSSVELQAAANQQATGSGEQATAMNEVSTTMRELLSTSRQIAESAQRVAHMADESARSASEGGQAVVRGQEAIAAIRTQVDQLVAHMLELGKKSQQIGAVLDITKELAEQTNILAINATIEAAGAGEHGRRFAAVAEEIRKLADRVSDSTVEIRGLIDDVRTSTNVTVMATENGAKTVEGGARQIGELAAAFGHIAGLVAATAEAAREIELSTKQQTTAVEQVNVAIADAAQAAKDTEASSHQTLQTSAQLAVASRELAVLIHAAPEASRA